jgi:hypothetical protein
VRVSDDTLICGEETWEKCKPFFKHLYDKPRLSTRYRLEDTATGRIWEGGDPYEWEAART